MPDESLHLIPGAIRPTWCERCQSAVAITVNLYLFGDTLTPPLVGEFTACPTCEPDQFEGGDHAADDAGP